MSAPGRPAGWQGHSISPNPSRSRIVLSLAGLLLLVTALVVDHTILSARDNDDAPAIIEVMLPDMAVLEIDGKPTTSTGSSRLLQTPPLVPGREFTYLLKVVHGGKAVEREIQVRAARTTKVDFSRDFAELPTAAPVKADTLWSSLKPVTDPAIPKVTHADRVRNPIDSFILEKLEAKGLALSPDADRHTLIRRLTFDLHGLPPTPEEVDAFVNDKSATAYEALVDRLLASPRYGERWGRHWLDVVHYGDTHGYDRDKRRPNAWPYRDYVIKSFNDDKPYSRFIREQLAGDVLFKGEPEALIATGFIAAGPWDFEAHNELREGTVDKLKTRLLDRDDMLANTMTTFTGMTVHCARCHDHKFDPIPQKDYYRLQAVFAGVERRNRVVSDNAADKRADLEKKRAAVAATLPAGWHSGIAAEADTTRWVQIDLGNSVAIDAIRLYPAQPVDVESAGYGFPLRYTVAVSEDATFQKSETVADYTLVDFENPGDKPVSVDAKGKKARYVRVTARLLFKRANDAYLFALSEIEVESDKRNVAAGAAVTAQDGFEAPAWHTRFLTDGFNGREWIHPPGDQAVGGRFEKAVADYASLTKDLAALPVPRLVYAIESISPRPIPFLKRGEVTKPEDLVAPGPPTCVTDIEVAFPNDAKDEGQRRAALAEWLTHPKNPRTQRILVNRVWQYHFGRGIVDTPSDFGKNGSLPSHPQLLDYLASRFAQDGESIKKLHKLIVTSTTYRQSSAHAEEPAKVDADNRLLWRMNRTRLEAEELRDSVLAVSGQLDLKMGGPGYEPFRFKDDKSPVYDHSDVARINDPVNWRRTVYRFAVRSVSDPFLECLDCADPSINTPVRNQTITAQQSLALLNDPFLVEQSKRFADRLQKAADTPAAQVDAGFRIAFGRMPTPEENETMTQLIKKRGLPQFCRVLFNANEFIFVD